MYCMSYNPSTRFTSISHPQIKIWAEERPFLVNEDNIHRVPSANHDTLHTAPKLTYNRKCFNNLFRTSDPKREVLEEPEVEGINIHTSFISDLNTGKDIRHLHLFLILHFHLCVFLNFILFHSKQGITSKYAHLHFSACFLYDSLHGLCYNMTQEGWEGQSGRGLGWGWGQWISSCSSSGV